VKLVDFGLACRVERPEQLLTTFSGTEQYAAPELLEGRAYDGFKTDAYALGVVLYLLLTAQYPFSPDDVDVQFEEQTSPAFLASLPFPAHVSSGARDLVWSLLRADPRRRLTVDGALKHPFFLVACAPPPGQAAAACEEPCRRHHPQARREELQAAVILASLDKDGGDSMSIGY
jgi:serine/threonine protein kinase